MCVGSRDVSHSCPTLPLTTQREREDPVEHEGRKEVELKCVWVWRLRHTQASTKWDQKGVNSTQQHCVDRLDSPWRVRVSCEGVVGGCRGRLQSGRLIEDVKGTLHCNDEEAREVLKSQGFVFTSTPDPSDSTQFRTPMAVDSATRDPLHTTGRSVKNRPHPTNRVRGHRSGVERGRGRRGEDRGEPAGHGCRRDETNVEPGVRQNNVTVSHPPLEWRRCDLSVDDGKCRSVTSQVGGPQSHRRRHDVNGDLRVVGLFGPRHRRDWWTRRWISTT